MTITILGIAGSLRAGSFNRRLLTAARHELPDGIELRGWHGLASVPPFDADLEHDPAPPAVADLRQAIEAADGLLIATPEYNGSVPGQLKNALDWASRPYGQGAVAGKPVAVLGASVGLTGAAWAREDLRKVLGVAGADVLDAGLGVPEAARQFDENDRLLDSRLRTTLASLLVGLRTRVGAGAAA
jgi:chromate reductase, NAD(P)H dehydrogenase (quinone)